MNTKRRRRHSPEQIVKKLRDADAECRGIELPAVLHTFEADRGFPPTSKISY